MIDRAQIIQSIGDKLEVGDDINPHTLRGVYTAPSYKEIATYFIDFNDQPLVFDQHTLEEFLNNVLPSYYYKSSKLLQWNHYFIFLRETCDPLVKFEIERNELYARKFVFSLTQLKEYFRPYKKSTSELDVNVVDKIKIELDEHGLSKIYSRSPKATLTSVTTEIIESGISSDSQNSTQTFNDPKSSNVNSNDSALEIKDISSIVLGDSYRQGLPRIREYKFGKVNLLTGANGTGKTSLLEAIELFVTGKTLRNVDAKEGESIIGGYNNGADPDKCSPSATLKYRKRGFLWYNSAEKKGNELYRCFNKYNFYNSDSAYKLYYSEDKTSISEYLELIALDPELNYVLVRVNKISFEVHAEYKRTKKDYDANAEILKSEETALRSIPNSQTPESVRTRLKSLAKEIGFKITIEDTSEQIYTFFSEALIRARSFAGSIMQSLENKKVRTESELNSIVKQLEKDILVLQGYNNSLTERSSQIVEVNNTLVLNKKKLEILKIALEYFEKPISFRLPELENDINFTSQNYAVLLKVASIASNVKIIKLDSNELFSEYYFKLEEQNRDLINTKTELENEYREFQSHLTALQSISSQIKYFGKQYIDSNPTADNCPLCGTPYPSDELLMRISEKVDDIKDSKLISNFATRTSIINERMIEQYALLESCKEISKGLTLLKKDDELMTLEAIGILFRDSLSESKQLKKQLDELYATKQELMTLGLSNTDFTDFIKSVKIVFPDTAFQEGNGDEFSVLHNNIQNENRLLENKLAETEASSEDIKKHIQDTISIYSIEADDPIKRLEYYRNSLIHTQENYEALKNIMDVQPNTDIEEINRRINELHLLNEEYKQANDKLFSFQTIEEKKTRIKQQFEKLQGLEASHKILEKIASDYKGSDLLEAFIKDNSSEIQEIFKKIHSPREFTVISFKKNEVYLKGEKDMEPRPLSQISSGQRSALAISIFLCLHRKLRKGPNIMLFDDPVANIDDLNILSFFDYLREIVLAEDRQIFFATADKKIAGLFEKKFAFLGENQFCKFVLKVS